MSLYDELQPYLDPVSAIVAGQGGGRDNLILNTATAISLDESIRFKLRFLDIFLLFTQLFPGVYSRFPKHPGPNSVDNVIGMICLNDEFLTQEIYEHGRDHYWFYSACGYPRIGDWYGRFLGFPAFVRFCAGVPMSKWDAYILRISFWFTSLSAYGDTSDKCLSVLQANRLGGINGPNKSILKWWHKSMTKKYPGGVKELYSIYYGKDHPFTKYAPEHF